MKENEVIACPKCKGHVSVFACDVCHGRGVVQAVPNYLSAPLPGPYLPTPYRNSDGLVKVVFRATEFEDLVNAE